jgi:putative membrane protein
MTKYSKILAGLFAVAIIWSAIGPTSYQDWALEIIPAIIAIPVVVYVGRRYALSAFSYTLIFIYLMLPVIQAHFGVAHVPFGKMIGEWMHSPRNMFDRVTHFAFGFLLGYPLYELFKQGRFKNSFLNYYLVFATIMAFSAVYEIIEWSVHFMTSRQVTNLFVAAQQDLWDSSEDMAMALFGLVIALSAIFLWERKRRKP